MSHHDLGTLDRDEHLENLLRETLRGRAARVYDGPQWAAQPTVPRRHAGLSIAAAVVAVVALAGGFAVWRSSTNPSTPAARGPHAQQVTLPTAWRQALHAKGPRIDGRPATPLVRLPSGAVVESATEADRSTVLVSASPDGSIRTRFRTAPGERVAEVRSDGRWLVFAVVTGNPFGDGSVGHIVSVDMDTRHAAENITRHAVPSGYVLGDGPELVDGVAYFTAVPAAEAAKAREQAKAGPLVRKPGEPQPVIYPLHGRVIAYTLATGRHRIVGSSPSLDSDGDPRGVFWPHGGVAAKNVPVSVPAFTTSTGHYRGVAHDGSSWAWDATDDGSSVSWTDGRTTRTWTTDIAERAHADLCTVVAVSGPYVVLMTANGVNPHLYVLDTRTGTYVDTGLRGPAVLPTDISRLPGLRRR